MCRDVDVGMMLALLAAISKANCEDRLAAAYRLLLWQSGRKMLPRRLAVAYVRLLRVRHPLCSADCGRTTRYRCNANSCHTMELHIL